MAAILEPGSGADERLVEVSQWILDFLGRPNPDLGRQGDVCPFVRSSFSSGLLQAELRDWSVDEADELYQHMVTLADEFFETAPLIHEADRAKLTFITVLPSFSPNDATPLDELQARLKNRFVERGLMVGQFHPLNQDPGLWSPTFRPLRSPIPLLAIRHMTASDLPFLLSTDGHIGAYCDKFAPDIPSHVRRHLVRQRSA